MAAALDALISAHDSSGDARVEHVDLAAQLEAIHPDCLGWAMACCGYRREDAEDALQDAYVGVLAGGARFRGTSSLRTWLFGVIRQKARASYRRDRMRERLGATHVARIDLPQAPAPPDERVLALDRRERLGRALVALPRRQREVLLLVFYHDLTIREAARIMSISLGSARTHYQRGKRQLARLLAVAACVVAIASGGTIYWNAHVRVQPLVLPDGIAALSNWRPVTDALLQTPGRALLAQTPQLGNSIIAPTARGQLR
jgi:RNA polymerase sigma factor (sigma-70 family)